MSNKIYEYPDSPQTPRWTEGPRQYWFHCPGCKNDHAFTVGGRGSGEPVQSPRWTFNGSFDAPTFQPSLLCNKDYPDSRCHSFVTNGKIQFLGDCFHSLKNQTVDLPDWEGWGDE
jgi:hypothetical protein